MDTLIQQLEAYRKATTTLIPIVCQFGKDILLNPAGVKEAHRSLTYTHIHMLDGKIYQVSDDDQKVWNQLRAHKQ